MKQKKSRCKRDYIAAFNYSCNLKCVALMYGFKKTTIYDGLKSQSSTSLYIYKVREDIRLDMIPADLNLAQADLDGLPESPRWRVGKAL